MKKLESWSHGVITSEDCMIVASVVLTQYQRVTDSQTDVGRTDVCPSDRSSVSTASTELDLHSKLC